MNHLSPSPRRVSRRTILRSCAGLVAGTECVRRLLAASPLQAADVTVPLNRYPRMMQEYLGARLIASDAVGTARRMSVNSQTAAEDYVKTVRELIRESFGPLPERTPLNPQITGVVQRDEYQIEKVIFESRPGFLVTANLYVPKGGRLSLPGVVGSCGHSINGKAAEAYQSFAQGLARQGYVVLIFDPIGQGERLQYPDELLKSKIGAGVNEHLLLGNQQFLVGEFFGTWRAWDGIRALDYLLTRPEVDPNRVGITGNSGGGTMTMWLCALEDRWTMAAPSCAVTTFRRNFDNELPTDTEQCPPLVLKHGLDHADFLAAMAPKPVIILAAEKDYFDVRGAIDAYERLQPIYKWLGAPENIRLFIGPTEHGYSQPNREAMYRFFNEHTSGRTDGREPQLAIERDDVLQCTPTGQVSNLGSRTVMSMTASRSKELTRQRGEITESRLRQRIVALLPSIPEPAPAFSILRPVGRRGYPKPHATWYALETERQTRSIVCRLSDKPHYSRPPNGKGSCLLYVAHQSSDTELRDEPLIKQIIAEQPEAEVFAVDLRGIGDSRPQTCGEDQFLEAYGSDYFYAAHAIMLGTSYVAQRTFDLLRVISWIRSLGRTEIHLTALEWGTIPATLASVVDADIQRVTLKRGLTSFTEIAESELYDWPLSALIPGVLANFDLPDCYRVLAKRKLNQIEPKSARPS